MSYEKLSEEYKLFIGGLCPKTDTDSMSEYFTQYGELSDCVVMKDPTSKRSRGFGFVTFTEKSSFDKCMDKTNHEIDGRLVEVKRAVPRNRMRPSQSHRVKKVFLGGMSPETTEADIREALKKCVCREEAIDRVQIMTDRNTDKPRGFGFVVFKGEDEAYAISDDLISRKYINIGDREVEVKPAKPIEEMKREDEMKSRPPYMSSAPRDFAPPRGMYDDTRMMSSSYYGGGSYDYTRGRDYMSSYPPSVYERTAGSGYGYESSASAAYSYPKYNYGGMMGSYPHTASSYGPTRSFDYSKERGDRAPYPYPRR